jgi:PAS domain S-box-containing protein
MSDTDYVDNGGGITTLTRLLWESAFQAIVLHDDGQILDVNPTFCRLFGYSSEEARRLSITDLVSEPQHPSLLRQTSDPTANQVVEGVGRRKDGTYFAVEVATHSPERLGGRLALLMIHDIDPRRRAEERCGFYDDMPLMYIETLHTPEGPIIENCNRLFADQLGYDASEIIGRPIADFYDPHSRTEMLTAGGYQRALEGQLQAEERRLLRRDGTALDTLLRAKPRRAGDGTVTGVRAVYMVITEQKHAAGALQQAKSELEQQHARLRALYQAGQLVNSTLKPETVLDYLTDEAMRVTCASHGQVLVVNEQTGYFERRSLRGFSPDEAERAHTLHLSLYDGINGATYTTQQMARVDDVSTGPGYFALIPSTRTEMAIPLIQNGKVLGNLDLQSPEVGAFENVDIEYLTALADQVAIALANAQLFRSVEQARQAWEVTFNAMRDAIALVASDGRVIQVNQAMASLAATPQNAMTGVDWPAILDTFSCRATAGNCGLLEGPRSLKLCSCVHQREGRIFEIARAPISDEQSLGTAQEARRLYTIRDITERTQAEEKLRAAATQLAQSNRELQDFASVASHDLQEPLRKIQAFSDRLKLQYRHALDGTGQDYLDRIQKAALRMQKLLDGVLSYSHTSHRALSVTPVDLTVVAEELVRDLRRSLVERAAQIEVEPLARIEADRVQMRQLLHHLIDNALKFHQADQPPAIRISGRVVNEPPANGAGGVPGPYLELRVRDNGIGFDEKYLEKIFTPFERLHSRDAEGATGIGLAICRKIVERHRGTITARSRPGEGATFVVTLPLFYPLEGEEIP